MFIKVLLPLKSMSSDGHAVIGCVDHIRVLQFTGFLKVTQDSPNLDINILAACKFTSQLVAYGAFITFFPDTFYVDLIT